MATANNTSGANQHHGIPLLEQLPDLEQILQNYINANVRQKDIPRLILKEYCVTIALRTVQKYMKQHRIVTTRRNGLNTEDQGAAILKMTEEDPLGRWGGRLVKEKLAHEGIHISRDFITQFQTAHNPETSASRHPATRKVHKHGLHSSGPNEEWCIDGHEKILRSMGIAISGIIDKYARIEINLLAVPNARLSVIPPVIFLRTVKKLGGMALSTASDMGSEHSKFIPLVTTLRQIYQPFLPEDTLPAHRATKSIFNITRERAWRPLWEKELGNVLHCYKSGKESIGFQGNNALHEGVALWLWGRIVQERLDAIVIENGNHFVRYQKKSLLPTGGRRIDFFQNPERWGGTDQLITVNMDDIEKLLEEYDLPEYTQFGSNEMVTLCQVLYSSIGSPQLSASIGWVVWGEMIDCYDADREN